MRETDQEIVKKTKKIRLLRQREFEKHAQKLYDTGIKQIDCIESEECIGLFYLSKDGSEKQLLILDARWANIHFLEKEYAELSYPGYSCS